MCVNIVGEQPPMLLLLHPAGLELQPLLHHVPQAVHLPKEVVRQAGPASFTASGVTVATSSSSSAQIRVIFLAVLLRMSARQ